MTKKNQHRPIAGQRMTIPVGERRQAVQIVAIHKQTFRQRDSRLLFVCRQRCMPASCIARPCTASLDRTWTTRGTHPPMNARVDGGGSLFPNEAIVHGDSWRNCTVDKQAVRNIFLEEEIVFVAGSASLSIVATTDRRGKKRLLVVLLKKCQKSSRS